MNSRRRRDVPVYSPLMVARTSRGRAVKRVPRPGVPGRVAVRKALARDSSRPQRMDLTAAILTPFGTFSGSSRIRSRLPRKLQTCVIGNPFEQICVQTSAHEPSSQIPGLPKAWKRLLADSKQKAKYDALADRHQRRAGQTLSGEADQVPAAGVTCLGEQVVGVGSDQ